MPNSLPFGFELDPALMAQLMMEQQLTQPQAPQQAQVAAAPFGMPMLPPVASPMEGSGRLPPQLPMTNLSMAPVTGKLAELTGAPWYMTGGAPPDASQAGMAEFGREALPIAASAALPMAGRAMGAFPKTTGLAAAAFGLGTPSQAGSAEADDQVRSLQQRLRDAGYYKGPIDGRMGTATQEANRAFEADQREKEKSAVERMRAEAEARKAGAETAETERKRLEGERQAQQRQEGEERLRQVEQNVPAWRRAIRDYSTPLGYALGFGTGFLARRGAVKVSDKMSSAAAERANALMATAPEADLQARVSRVNQFWGEGQAGIPQAPFSPAPGTRMSFKANPNAPPAAELYQPKPGWPTDVGILGTFGLESGLSQNFANQARTELAAAQEAVNRDPSEVNIQRMQTATDRLAIFDGLTYFGRMGMAGYGTGMFKKPRNPTRPDVNVAEAERLRIDQMLAPQRRVAGPATTKGQKPGEPPEGATWNASAQRWVKGGRFVSGAPPPRKDWREYPEE